MAPSRSSRWTASREDIEFRLPPELRDIAARKTSRRQRDKERHHGNSLQQAARIGAYVFDSISPAASAIRWC